MSFPSDPGTHNGPGALGIAVIVGSLLLAAWVVGGRYLFGVAGELTPIYALTFGPAIIGLHSFAGLAIGRATSRGHRVRPATLGLLAASWGCGILLGLTIPDITPAGLQTIVSGTSEPGLGIATGVSNPLGVVMLVTAIAALVLANGDARGRAAVPDDDADEQ